MNGIWWLLKGILFRFDPERAHVVTMGLFAALLRLPGVAALTRWLMRVDDPRLRTRVVGLDFENPVGLAAGFDKNAEWFDALHALGFGFVEVGTLTAHAQPGNPTPRIFRLPADRALINRLGFNNRGSEAAAASLRGRPIGPVLGINIGKSKITPNESATEDYLTSFERLFPYAAYLTVNVSSPNTQGLRDLQAMDPLRELLRALLDKNEALAAARGESRRPVFVKIAPDLTPQEAVDVVELAVELGLDGIIATNTTIGREGLVSEPALVEAAGAGGLSGAPLRDRALAVLRRVRAALLVAPADVERTNCPPALQNFAPIPQHLLPFPSLLLGSDNDAAASAARASELARDWGSEAMVLSGVGHINVASGHQRWEQGFAYLYRLQSLIERHARRTA